MRRALIISVVTGTLVLASSWALAAEQERTRQGTQLQTQEQIFGSQLMTEEERAEYRARMRSARTVEEREAIRLEHHQRMRERAAAQGITLPEEPPMSGGGGMRDGGGIAPGGRGTGAGGYGPGGYGPGGGGRGR
jgi:hypothetical protein